MTSETPRRRPRRSGSRRRLGGVVRLAGALMLAGVLYTVFAPGLAAQEEPLSDQAQEGREIYERTCISCHGENGQGIPGRGPSLIGVGEAAVEFQVSTGRMPLARQGAQAEPKPPYWQGEELEQNIRALSAYIDALGGGPRMPAGTDLGANGDPAAGGELYRVNCSSCHGFGGGGGSLSAGAFAPNVLEATDRQIWAAMLSGPQNMPVFGDNQLTPQEKADIVAFIDTLSEDRDPGGLFNLGRFGPSTEGLAIFLVGIMSMVVATLWIAGKS